MVRRALHDRAELDDVQEMLRRRLVNRAGLLDYFNAVEAALYRYPSIDAAMFRQAVLEVAAAPR